MQNPPDMKVRLSAELRRQVEAAAKANNRTLNAEIVSRLERTFREDSGNVVAETSLSSDDLAERLSTAQAGYVYLFVNYQRLEERIEKLENRLEKAQGIASANRKEEP
jgi:hypothetical protein